MCISSFLLLVSLSYIYVSLLVYHLFLCVSVCVCLSPPSSVSYILPAHRFPVPLSQASTFLISLFLPHSFLPAHLFHFYPSHHFLLYFSFCPSLGAAFVDYNLGQACLFMYNVPSPPLGSFKPLEVCTSLNLALVLSD